MSSKVVAEYAKSNRSSCKKCSKPISVTNLRLGLVTKDPRRGFETTKWHHFDCFSDFVSFESIQGFSGLKNDDQEALKVKCTKLLEVSDGNKDTNEGVTDNLNKRGNDNLKEHGGEIKERSSSLKRIKVSDHNVEANMHLSLSLSTVQNKYKDATLLPNWKAFQTIIFLEQDDNFQGSPKIAAFDFDGCLAKTSVRRVGADAWSLMYPSIPDKLRSLHSDGYKLVIFTNESNIERWKNKRQAAVDSKIGRLNNFIELVKVPIQVFIACGTSGGKLADPFRKPMPGMWRFLEQHFNSGISIDMDQSFYVGDAAGRPNDHSDADIKFAEAVGVKFYVPEDYFGA